TKTGRVSLGPLVLHAGMTPQELTVAGIVVGRVVDMKTGWILRTTGPYMVLGREMYVSLEFYMDQLKRIAMGLGDRPSLDLQGLFAEHAAFLQQELGAPSRVKNG